MKWQDQKDEFKKMVGELSELLNTKGKEYSGDDDALNNFKRGIQRGAPIALYRRTNI